MSNMTACQYKKDNEMDGHLLPTGLLMKSQMKNKQNKIHIKRPNRCI